MKAWLKWFLAVLLLILLTPLIISLLLDQDHYKQLISNAVESKTGRTLVIEGDLKLTGGFNPGISAESIRYLNAPWSARPWAVEVDKAKLTIDFWALLQGNLKVDGIVLQRPRMWVEKNAAGSHNFAIDPALLNPDKVKSLPGWLNVSSAKITDGEIIIATANRRWEVGIHEAQIETSGRDKPVTIDLRGEIEQTPITASATLGSLETLFAFHPSLLSIDGFIGSESNRVIGNGSARDLLKWRGIDLELGFVVEQLPELSALVNITLSDVGRVDGQAGFRQPEGVRSMQLEGIQLNSTKFGLQSTVIGEFTDLYNLDGIDLAVSIAGNLDLMSAGNLAALVKPLDVNLIARLSGSSRNLDLVLETATAQNAELLLTADGVTNRRDSTWQQPLPVTLAINDSSGLSRVLDREIPQLGPLEIEAELTQDQGFYNLSNLKLALEREGLRIKAAGAVNHLNADPEAHLYFIVDTADSTYLQPLVDNPLPPVSAMKLEAAVDIARDTYRATIDKLSGLVYGVGLSATGTINELNQWRGIDLAITGQAKSLDGLAALTGRSFPENGRLVMDARLIDDESGTYHLKGITASIADPANELLANGEILDLGASMQSDLDLELKLARVDPAQGLFPDFEWDLLPFEIFLPVEASAKLRSTGWADWEMGDITVTALADGVDATLSGDISRFGLLDAGFHLTLNNLPTPDFRPLREIPLPRESELDLALDLVVKQGIVSIENVMAAMDSTDITMALQGDIDYLNPLQISTMQLEFDAINVATLGWLNTDLFNPDNPVSGSISLATGTESNRSDIAIKIGSSDVNGTVDWRLPGDKQATIWIRADLDSDRLDIKQLLVPDEKQPRLFSTLPINTDWIHKIDGQINLAAGRINNRLLELSDVKAQVELKQGTLRQAISGSMGEGNLAMTLALDANSQPFSVEYNMIGKQLDAAGLVVFREDEFFDGGTFDWDIGFISKGDSMATLAANATGQVSIRLNQARMKNQVLGLIGGDIFSNVVTVVNPFREIGEYVEIECSVFQFEINQGIATSNNGLAMKTDKVTLLGGGSIDLSDESLKILISPKARKGFGINPSSLAKMIRIGGTLDEPKIETDFTGFLQSGAAFWAAFYSGGLSLVAQGLLDRSKANANVCDLAGSVKVEERNTKIEPAEER